MARMAHKMDSANSHAVQSLLLWNTSPPVTPWPYAHRCPFLAFVAADMLRLSIHPPYRLHSSCIGCWFFDTRSWYTRSACHARCLTRCVNQGDVVQVLTLLCGWRCIDRFYAHKPARCGPRDVVFFCRVLLCLDCARRRCINSNVPFFSLFPAHFERNLTFLLLS